MRRVNLKDVAIGGWKRSNSDSILAEGNDCTLHGKFFQGEAFRKESLPVRKSGKFEYEFSDVPYGKYVIAAFHDLDDNKKLNSSLIGMPSEPYGFSRNARGTFGAPSFSEAVITFDKDHAEFSFRIK